MWHLTIFYRSIRIPMEGKMKDLVKMSAVFMVALFVTFGPQHALGAEKYPEKPGLIVCHTTVGGGADLFARILAASVNMNNLLSQTMVVENKPGGSGGIAYAYVAGKKKDPHYLLTTVTSFLTTPLMGLTPITYKDFTPISCLISEGLLVMTGADSKYQSIKEIVAYAKTHPKAITVGGTQLGAMDSILTSMFAKTAGIELNYIVFNGPSEVNASILGGHIDLCIGNPSEVIELYKAGKVKILGVFADERMAEIPEIPTMKEQGVNISTRNFRGITAPANIPEDARKVLEEALFKAVKTDMFKKYLKDNIISERYMNGPDFGKFLEEQNDRFAAILKDMNLYKKK